MLLRDPIHGDIELSPAETAILDLPVMQRLRGIKQLGTAYLVYPGALHTRFDHSVGACAMAHRIVADLVRGGLDVPPELEDAIGVAGLLHDVTHIPFGHTLEDERRLFPRHDKGTRLAALFASDLGDALARHGLADQVAALLHLPGNQGGMPEWASDIVSGTIDADLLDYLRRDSFFTGLSHNYDDRILRSFTVHGDRLALRLSKHGMDRPDARSEIIGVLRLRYFLTERVYYHHTKVVAGALISKAVEQALEHGLLEEADFLRFNDWTLLDRLESCGIAGISALAQRIAQRNLLKRAYVVSGRSVPLPQRQDWVTRYHLARTQRAQAEMELATTLNLPFSEVVVYCPALSMMKEADVAVETNRGLAHLNAPGHPSFAEIDALQERYSELWRFYVFVPEHATSRAAVAAAEMFGLPSEHGGT
ncbi:phosphohydrolase [Azospira sp. I13]|uniref:HD domain-containing protein n=1 Tax=Azospira sp. I13 TaxID=1765050 RepID=UPI000D40A5DE|nr:HD domain-containing protein [Azospira sp. I13]GBG03718.1 phosphohydrolase [Azospira sp. I13]